MNTKVPISNTTGLTCLFTVPLPDQRKKKKAGVGTSSSGEQSYNSLDNQGHGTGSGMTVYWFSKIKLSPEYQKLLSYPESCLIISDDGQGIGKMYTMVEMSTWAGIPCMLVHSGSYAKIRPDVDVGTSLTGFITPELRIIQELCHEWCYFKGTKFDRKTFLMESLENSLHCRSTFKRNDVVKYDHVTSIPFIDLKTLVSESVNVVFQRLLILEKKTGTISLRAMSAEGSTIPVDYRILGRGVEDVKGEKVEVYGIRRSIWSDNITKSGQAWDSVFNFYGRLVLRCQPEGNDHALIPLWFRPIDEYDDFGQYIGMRPPIVWVCDQELYSKYLIKKTELTAQYKTYLMDHPALRSLLSDFIQKLLIQKPQDVFKFAHDFFTPLLKLRNDSPESSECETSSSCGSDDEDDREHDEYPGETDEIMENIINLHRKLFPLVNHDEMEGKNYNMEHGDNLPTSKMDNIQGDTMNSTIELVK